MKLTKFNLAKLASKPVMVKEEVAKEVVEKVKRRFKKSKK